MIETIYSDPNFLEHHGVLGMKWGVRKDRNRKTNRSNSRTKPITKKKNQSNRLKVKIDADAKTIAKENYEKLKNKSKEIDQLSNELTNDYVNLAKDIEKDPQKYKDEIFKGFANSETGKGFNEWIANRRIDDIIDDDFQWFMDFNIRAMADPTNKQAKLNKAIDDYFEESKKLTNSLLDKYSDKKTTQVTDDFYKKNVEEYINDIDWDGNAQWNSYVSRHFDDYFVGPEAYENMYDIISDNYNAYEYEKWLNK